MELGRIKTLTILDLIEFASLMRLPLRDAIPKVKEYVSRHEIEESDVKHVANAVTALGLYK